MRSGASISAHMASFLDFCRIEKGLARTTIESYRLDLERFASSLGPAGAAWDQPESVRRHIDSLYRAKLASRSISRHLTTIRNLYRFRPYAKPGRAQAMA
jgi:integrase/recombinase XerD